MPTQILPAASLSSACRLPAAQAPVRAANDLICNALWAIGWTIFRVIANFSLLSGRGASPWIAVRGEAGEGVPVPSVGSVPLAQARSAAIRGRESTGTLEKGTH